MAVVGESQDCQTGKLVGLKLEVSPDLIPRDLSIGTKIFMLLPSEGKSVRDVKRYIGNYVIKTPAPFHVYMGEYRIRDEEDAQIFSLMNEPCRLMPIPIPRPALSSTPKPKAALTGEGVSGVKRVTFFDGDISASPVRRPGENGIDVLDDSRSSAQVIPSDKQFFTPSPALIAQNIHLFEKSADNDDDNSSERRKRRRRKHRSKKSKYITEEEETDDVKKEIAEPLGNGASSNSSLKRKTPPDSEAAGTSSSINNGSSTTVEKLGILNEETESEDETKEGDTATATQQSKEILSPKAVEPLKRTKKQKLSDSAFVSSESFTSPVSSTISDDSRVGKTRQDTPIVPRVVKNPRVFESVRKILHVYPDANEPMQDSAREVEECKPGNNGSTSKVVSQDNPKDEQFYKSLMDIHSAGEVEIGDKIAFRVLELDERYNPSVSAFKEAMVLEKIGGQLTIEYIKNEKVIRTGIYDLPMGDEEETPNCENEEVTIIQFSDCLEPKYMLSVSKISAPVSQPLCKLDPVSAI